MHTYGELNLAIIGLGYVGLPLAVEFGKKLPVVGFDINQARIEELRSGHDHTLEVEPEVTFLILLTRCCLSPGLIRSGL